MNANVGGRAPQFLNAQDLGWEEPVPEQLDPEDHDDRRRHRPNNNRGRERDRNRGRGRGRRGFGRYRQWGQDDESDYDGYQDDEGIDDEDPDDTVYAHSESVCHADDDSFRFNYERNRRVREKTPASIPVQRFDPDEKTADWASWVRNFQLAVFNSHKPHTKNRHYNLCCEWLCNYLSPRAITVWEKSKVKNDWVKLRADLEDRFDDPVVRENWRSDLECYQWDPERVPLQVFYANVIRLCDKYDPHYRESPKLRQNNYYDRFRNGLPEKYKSHLILSMSAKGGVKDDKDLELAVRIVGAYHLNKKRQEKLEDKKKHSSDIAGAFAQRDTIPTERVSAHDRDLAEQKVLMKQLSSRLEKMEEKEKIRSRDKTPHPEGKSNNLKQGGSRPNSQNRSGSSSRDGYRSSSGNRSLNRSYNDPKNKYYVSYDDAKSRLGNRPGRPDLNRSNMYNRYRSNVNAACADAEETIVADLDDTVDEFGALDEADRAKRFQKFVSDKKRFKDQKN